MTNAQLATASLDDIVFDGRNRHYGAYELRALYQRHMTRALVIATAMLALLLAFPLLAQLVRKVVPAPVAKDKGRVVLIAPPIDLRVITPPVIPPVRAVAPPTQSVQHVATTKFTEMRVTPDDQAPDEVPDQKLLATTTVATTTQLGSTTPEITELTPVDTGKETGEVVSSKPYYSVEQMPELPGGGGQLAIVKAIQNAVHYPAQALRNQVEGKVFVSFTVDPKGDITDVKIVKGLGYGLDEETMRAIKTLPRFIPGKQNGREVSVSFTVPVTYQIQ